MEHFEKHVNPSPGTLAAFQEAQETLLLLPAEENKVWKDPEKELRKLQKPLRELLTHVKELESLLTPAQEKLFLLLKKKYFLELQLTPVTLVKKASKKFPRKSSKTLSQEDIDFLKAAGLPPIAQTAPAPAVQTIAWTKPPYDPSLITLSEDEELYFTFQKKTYRVTEFSFFPSEKGSSVKAPVQEDLTIIKADVFVSSIVRWVKIDSSSKLNKLSLTTEFLAEVQNFRQLQQENF